MLFVYDELDSQKIFSCVELRHFLDLAPLPLASEHITNKNNRYSQSNDSRSIYSLYEINKTILLRETKFRCMQMLTIW